MDYEREYYHLKGEIELKNKTISYLKEVIFDMYCEIDYDPDFILDMLKEKHKDVYVELELRFQKMLYLKNI